MLAKTGYAQSRYNARAMALGGAYSSIARGFYCVGYNPANLALPSDYRTYINIAGLNLVATNNFLSLERNSKYSGKDLTANAGSLQDEFLDDLPANGWRTNFGFDFPLPFLNLSINNRAYTTDIIYFADYYLSEDALRVLYGGIDKGIEYDLDLRYDATAIIQYGYSMALPFNSLALGFSLKYLQGLAYCGLDSRYRRGSVFVDTTNFLNYVVL